ncbi:hypothetical protein [Litorivivens sp.]|uniref:hypothetical protein n=1 Tax=Litorivivens sp. TaxID=2020868 RepID=UPI003568CDBD
MISRGEYRLIAAQSLRRYRLHKANGFDRAARIAFKNYQLHKDIAAKVIDVGPLSKNS